MDCKEPTVTDPELAKCTYTGSNPITSEWKQRRVLMEFLITYGIDLIKSSRADLIFKPIPKTWQNLGIHPSLAPTNLNLNLNSEEIFNAISLANNDENLIQKKEIGDNTYGFIKFLLHLNTAILIERVNLIYYNELGMANKRVAQFKFTYTSDNEARFKGVKTVYRFHGTPAENVIPIIANGLKNCSRDDKMRLNGAAHGDGIYLSDSAAFSVGYCRSSHGGHIAMLVYEVIDDPKWFKTSNIYVIDDENSVILRYVVIIKSYDSGKDVNLFEKLTSAISGDKLKEAEAKIEKEKQVVVSQKFNKRLMIEYKTIIKKTVEELGFSMRLTAENNLRVWCITITRMDNPELEAQMKELGIPGIELEITFPEGYPIEPPFPRVVYPRFKSLTGHITAGGAICMQAISKQGWVPTTNMEALITQIRIALVDMDDGVDSGKGRAQIDKTYPHTRYGSMEEAKEAFQRAMTLHGWG